MVSGSTIETLAAASTEPNEGAAADSKRGGR